MIMSTNDEIQHILHSAMKLNPTARAFIAEELLNSLDIETGPPLSDQWKIEIARRCEQIDRGEIELVPEDQAFREGLEALG